MRRPLVAGLVLERDAEADPELLHLSVLDRHVLADDLRDAQVADGLRRGRNGVAGGIRPGLGAGPDDLGDPVDAAGHSDFLLGWAAGKADSFRPRAAGPPRAASPPVTWRTGGYVISGMMRIATMFATLIIGLIAGPAVSLNGSPTVSPVTEAAWASEPLPP